MIHYYIYDYNIFYFSRIHFGSSYQRIHFCEQRRLGGYRCMLEALEGSDEEDDAAAAAVGAEPVPAPPHVGRGRGRGRGGRRGRGRGVPLEKSMRDRISLGMLRNSRAREADMLARVSFAESRISSASRQTHTM